jgi:hypothetical protein
MQGQSSSAADAALQAASGFDALPAVTFLFPSELSLLVKLEDVLDELFPVVETGGLTLFDEF